MKAINDMIKEEMSRPYTLKERMELAEILTPTKKGSSKKPTKFLNQREAFWYLQGIKDSLKSMTFTLKQDIERNNLDYLDHLPKGESEQKRCKR